MKDIKFRDFNLDERLLAALDEKGFVSPTEIQARTLELAFSTDKNIVGSAQTGTGKTAAFGLPMLHAMDESKGVKALILCPTRELAGQVATELDSLKGKKPVKVAAVYGGSSYSKQLGALKAGDQVIVGTPGRVVDHIKRGSLKLEQMQFMVLDEADEMLNMGFQEELEFILSHVPEFARKFLFSATMNDKMLQLIKKYVPEYEYIEVKKKSVVTSLSKQQFFEVKERQKMNALSHIIDDAGDFYGIVFCRTKADVEQVKDTLIRRGYRAACIHGDIPQNKRESVLQRFKERKVNILVATDVAARGIDIADLNYVVNYHLPEDSESYVHRVGRTGRAGNSGFAVSLVSCQEHGRMGYIKKETKIEMEQIHAPTLEQMQSVQLDKVVAQLKSRNPYKQKVISDKLVTGLLEQFDPVELVERLLEKSNQGLALSEFEPIDKTKSRKSGGRRRSRFRGGRGRGRGGSSSRGRRSSGRPNGRNSRSRESHRQKSNRRKDA